MCPPWVLAKKLHMEVERKRKCDQCHMHCKKRQTRRQLNNEWNKWIKRKICFSRDHFSTEFWGLWLLWTIFLKAFAVSSRISYTLNSILEMLRQRTGAISSLFAVFTFGWEDWSKQFSSLVYFDWLIQS
jgi:hypothetical protein